jgi:glycosyltransferase involved in cell wall biosynthesis
MKKLKILIINDKGFPFGGVEVRILNQKRELIRRGHVVKIFSSNFDYGKENFSDYRFSGFNEKSIIKWFNQIFNLRSYFKLKEILKEFKPDIIHIFNIYYQVSPSILKCLKNIPTIMSICSYEMICPMGAVPASSVKCNYKFRKQCLKCIGSFKGYYYEKVKQKIYKIFLNNVDVFVAPSKNTKKNFKKQDFINSEVITIYNGIKLLKYSEIKNTKTILYVGRLSKEKGVEYLLKAMPLIIKEIPTVHLDIVGDGDEKHRLEILTKELNLEKSVAFIGSISHSEVEKYYKKANIVTITSIWPEPFGLIGPEAMSVGRPVIGTKVGGIPEWLEDGRTGFLVEPKNSKDIANKIIKLFENQKLLKMMGKRAYIKSAQFSIEEYAKNLESLYEKILKKYTTI